ncbi:MAG: endolytic transglycosylase MltG [Phocaeicola sp.]
MTKKKRYSLITTLALLLAILAGSIGSLYYYLLTPLFQHKERTYIYIDRDDTIDSVLVKIQEVGKPKSMKGFELLSKHFKYAERIRTGKYLIDPNETMHQFQRKLMMGYQTPIRLTVASTRTLDRLIQGIANQLMIDSVEIAQLVSDSTFQRKMGYTEATVGTLFIPNTYEVYWNTSPEKLLERMQKERERFWNEKRMTQAKALNLTPEEVMILASIVEEETAYNPEKPTIAGLYLNRLKRGMLLQADPTVKFAWQEFELRRILYKHLEIDSPYNTYKYLGLPPGPIRIPSIIGIESVLNHEEHNYLYMCAKEDFSGKHSFATNLTQHGINARRYQQALNQRRIR